MTNSNSQLNPIFQRSIRSLGAVLLVFAVGCTHFKKPLPIVDVGDRGTGLTLVSRGGDSFERTYGAGSTIAMKGGGQTPREAVRLTTFDVVTGKMHLQGAEGQRIEPISFEEVREITLYREPKLNLWAAIGIGVGGGALVGGWFWYNAFEYIRYEGDELAEATLVTTALTTLATGFIVPWLFSKASPVHVSTVGQTGEWKPKGQVTAEEVDSPPPDSTLPGVEPGSVSVPSAPPAEEGGAGFWGPMKDRLVDVRVGETWGRFRVGTSYPEGVQLKAIGSPRGRIVPYADIQEIRREPGGQETE